MAHFCWFLKLLLFLLLMMSWTPAMVARPTRGAPSGELIAGNEFLKLFLERDELQGDLLSGEYQGRGSRSAATATVATTMTTQEENNYYTEESSTNLKTASRSANGRSLSYKSRSSKQNTNEADESDSKQVKLVTTGSKIVFLEEYDDNDAVVDAVAREIDLKKERPQPKQEHKSNGPSDEVKVVAVSVSSSSKRASSSSRDRSTASESTPQRHKFAEIPQKPTDTTRQHHKTPHAHERIATASTTARPTKAASTSTRAPSTTSADFINRSHKSEFSIEEAEPLTLQPRNKARARARSAASIIDALNDSENSASTNVQKVLAAPLMQAASTRSLTYHSGGRNSSASAEGNNNNGEEAGIAADMSDTSAQSSAGVEDKLLPFQTVIYHDTKEGGHGPQSRSISYSSISQNVEDLHAWQRTGILAEAQRNVNESLKPAPATQAHAHVSEPAKFYSVPAKMYGVPAKFYSEPAKVYSEPAKVYGQPEKFYSEPAKVYGQPAKFYSEPAKVYGEPAKTYWPNSAIATTTTTSSPTTTTTSTTTTSPTPRSTTSTNYPVNYPPYSRRPAIVSRIAFGEAQTTTTSTPTPPPPHVRPQMQSHNSHPSQSRRVLYNLDKLPYDLLNAPQQSPKHLLDPELTHTPPAAVTYSSPRERQCLESAFSASQSLSTSQHQHQLQRQRQHSSLSDQQQHQQQQHSNQNAKGLPNRDLVKCVTKYSHSLVASTTGPAQPHYPITTESSHIEDLYTPTPEQNYEIEESSNKSGGSAGNDDEDDSKVAYVVEGRNYRKYRVEEKTDDGFIVGEYGVVDHNDGNLRGVRYTADSTINPSLIQQALLTFLKLK